MPARRLLKRRLSAHGPRLYSDEEFFVAEHGFHVKMVVDFSSDDGYIGYATLGLMVGKELLDYAEENHVLEAQLDLVQGKFLLVKVTKMPAWKFTTFPTLKAQSTAKSKSKAQATCRSRT